MEMNSNQPYLFRAIYDWIIDNGATPYILVNADSPDVHVPAQSVKDGQIVLNIAPRAVSAYQADNEAVSFTARFSGVPEKIYVPMTDILAIYAAENAQGMVFSQESIEDQPLEDNTSAADLSDINTEPQPEPEPPKPGGKPFLKVIK